MLIILILSHSPGGVKQSLRVIHKRAQDWKLKVKQKIKRTSYGKGQNNKKIYFKYQNETYHIVDKQT